MANRVLDAMEDTIRNELAELAPYINQDENGNYTGNIYINDEQ